MFRVIFGLKLFARLWSSKISQRRSESPSSPEDLNPPTILREHGRRGERPSSSGGTNPSTTTTEHRQRAEGPLSSADTRQQVRRGERPSTSSSEDKHPYTPRRKQAWMAESPSSDSACLSNNQSHAEETKAKRSNSFSRFICKIFLNLSISSDMDTESEDMHDISSTPPFSMESATSEDLDELMNCDDLLEDQEVTGLRTYSVISDESRMSNSSCWGSSRDADISDTITSFDQNIDGEIIKVCHSFFNLEDLETEADDFGENKDVWTTDTGSTTSLAIRSNESTVPASCASSSSFNTAITKADKMLMQSTAYLNDLPSGFWHWFWVDCSPEKMPSKRPEDPTRTESMTSEFQEEMSSSLRPASCASSSSSNSAITKADNMLMQSTEAVKIQTDNYLELDSKEVMMEGGCKGKRNKLQWKRWFSGRRRNRIQPALLEHLKDVPSGFWFWFWVDCSSEEMPSTACSAALGADLRSTQLQRVDYTEDEDQTPEDTKNVLSSLSPSSLLPPYYRVDSFLVLDSEEVIMEAGYKKRKKSQWKRWLSRRRRNRIQPASWPSSSSSNNNLH